MSDANDPVLARTQPARSTTPDRSTTPGSGLPSAADSAGHDARHRLGVGRLGGLQLGRRRACPVRQRSRPIAIRSTSGQSTSPRRAAFSARRPATVAAAPSAEPIRNPACQTRSSRHDGRVAGRIAAADRSSRRSSGRDRQLDLLDVGERRAEQPPGQRVERGRVAGRQLEVPGVRCVGPSRRLEAVDLEQLGQRRRRRRRRVDDRDAVAGDRRR